VQSTNKLLEQQQEMQREKAGGQVEERKRLMERRYIQVGIFGRSHPATLLEP
jgi:hypothetical protein